MKFTSSLIFLVVLIIGGFCADTTTTVNPTTETTTSVQSTTVTESTVTTSQKPDTTTVSTTTNPTTTTTELPTTTTTVASTTTSQPDTTTSVRPTTVPPATSTKSPEPPTPEEGSWNVTEGTWTCIRADLQIRFDIPVKNGIEYIVLSPNATSVGSCNVSENTEVLQLTESEYTLTLTFEKDSTNAYLKNITFIYTLPESSGLVYNDSKLFSVKVDNSYMCASTSYVNLQNVTMEIMQMHIQSFGKADNKGFGFAEECSADTKVNDMVPIAVGIALLVLVVVVLVAYFVGRRRSRQKGYQSV